MIDVSIVIVTYNSQNFIEAAIKSINDKTYYTNYEIIICDNNSSDNTIETVKNSEYYKKLNIKIIKNDYNYGYAKAANIAAKESKGNCIFFLNPDTRLKNNAIDILYPPLVENPEIAVTGGLLLNVNNDYVFSCGFLPDINDIISIFSNNIKGKKQRKIKINKKQYVELISGCDFLVKKEIFDYLNGFDEDYFMYYEELDFCFRLKKQKYKLLYNPEAKIIHFTCKSQETPYKTASYNFRSAYLYCIKNLIINNFILFKLLFFFLLFFMKNNFQNINDFKKNIIFLLKEK